MTEAVFGSYKLVDRYAPKEALRGWNADQFLEGGLQGHLDSDLAVRQPGNIDGYMLATLPPEALPELYSHTVFVLPEEGAKSIGTVHQLPIKTVKGLHGFIHDSVISIMRSAAANGDRVTTVYANQHVGQNEVNGHPFNSTLLPVHFHVFSYDQDGLEDYPDRFHRLDSSITQNSFNKHLLRDSLFPLMEDIIQHDLAELDVEVSQNKKGGSFAISIGTTADEVFTEREIVTIREVSALWELRTQELTDCFTDGEIEEATGRPTLLGDDIILERVEDFIGRSEFLGEKSIRLLRFLAKHIKDADEVDIWSWFFKGQAGCIAWEFDFKTNKRRIILAPRSQVVRSKNWAVLPDGASHIVIKDKNTTLPPETTQEILDFQRGVNRQLKAIIDKRSIVRETPDIHSNQGDVWIGDHTVVKRFRFSDDLAREEAALIWLQSGHPGIAPKLVSSAAEEGLLEMENAGKSWKQTNKRDIGELIKHLTPLWLAFEAPTFPSSLIGQDMINLRMQLFNEQVLSTIADDSLREKARKCMEDVLAALSRTSPGIAHVDVSPNNICTDSKGKIRVIDWSRAAYTYPIIDIAMIAETFGRMVRSDNGIEIESELCELIDALPFCKGNEGLIKCLALAFDIKKGITGRSKPKYSDDEVNRRLETFINIAQHHMALSIAA